MTLHSPDALAGEQAPLKARDGFSLNAAVVCETHQRDKLEHLCQLHPGYRYVGFGLGAGVVVVVKWEGCGTPR